MSRSYWFINASEVRWCIKASRLCYVFLMVFIALFFVDFFLHLPQQADQELLLQPTCYQTPHHEQRLYATSGHGSSPANLRHATTTTANLCRPTATNLRYATTAGSAAAKKTPFEKQVGKLLPVHRCASWVGNAISAEFRGGGRRVSVSRSVVRKDDIKVADFWRFRCCRYNAHGDFVNSKNTAFRFLKFDVLNFSIGY